MKQLCAVLALGAVGTASLLAQSSDPTKINAYLKTLPTASTPVFDEPMRETLATSAISCADHPQEMPPNRNNFLWQYAKAPTILDGYDKNRSFFGCSNWHEAVGSTWALVSLLKQDPKIGLASDIKDITTTHFKKTNTDAELAFFNTERPTAGGPNFERPYGYAWLIKLYGEAKAGSSSDDKKLATALAPLAKWMSERLVFYLYDLKFPYRSGVETNTAWTMSVILDGANLSENETLKTAVQHNAIRLFSKDKTCATAYEPQNSDLISSCLSEAAIMGRVMDQAAYVKWLDAFLPPVYSDAFQVYAKGIDVSHTSTTGPDAEVQELAKSRLIALNFQRATSLQTISYALPKDDARVAVYRRLAQINAHNGYKSSNMVDYEGRNLFSIYAMLYENVMKGPAPLGPPPKPKSKSPSDAEKSEGETTP